MTSNLGNLPRLSDDVDRALMWIHQTQVMLYSIHTMLSEQTCQLADIISRVDRLEGVYDQELGQDGAKLVARAMEDQKTFKP